MRILQKLLQGQTVKLKEPTLKYKSIFFLAALQVRVFSCVGQVKGDDIVGLWLTHGKEPAKIQIYNSGGKYYGKIVWLKNPTDNGKPKLDLNNPDNNKRNQVIIGLLILRDFRFDGDDQWNDGDIYDPERGKTYSCHLTLQDKNNLKVRGYIGISLFGRTEVWTRTN